MSDHCVICQRPHPPSHVGDMVCYRKPCRTEYQTWAVANYDQLDVNSKWRKHFEDKFWEVTPQQRQHYARFFELMRPVKSHRKQRPCLKCGKTVSNANSQMLNDFRLCCHCQMSNAKHGALCHATPTA